MWRPDTASAVVVLDRAPANVAGGVSPLLPSDPVARFDASDGRHLVLDRACVRHRLWLREGDPDARLIILLAPGAGPAALAAAAAAGRMICGKPARVSATLPGAFQRRRLHLLLDILDADLAGACNRDIGMQLVFPRLCSIRAAAWKASNERRQTQRLIAEARAMMEGGYRRLLAE